MPITRTCQKCRRTNTVGIKDTKYVCKFCNYVNEYYTPSKQIRNQQFYYKSIYTFMKSLDIQKD